jgi:hypothetical protein
LGRISCRAAVWIHGLTPGVVLCAIETGLRVAAGRLVAVGQET